MKETLTLGDRGKAVRAMNDGLRALGYEAGTGDRFTQSTARGLFSLQTDRGLEATGEGDSRTRSLLSLLICNDPGEAFYGDADGDGLGKGGAARNEERGEKRGKGKWMGGWTHGRGE